MANEKADKQPDGSFNKHLVTFSVVFRARRFFLVDYPGST